MPSRRQYAQWDELLRIKRLKRQAGADVGFAEKMGEIRMDYALRHAFFNENRKRRGENTGALTASPGMVFLSPLFLYGVLSLFALSLVFLPESLYEKYVREEYLLDFNWRYSLLIILGYLAFATGVFFSRHFGRRTVPSYYGEGRWAAFGLGAISLIGNVLILAFVAKEEIQKTSLIKGLLLSGYTKQDFENFMEGTHLGWVFPVSVFSVSLFFWYLVSKKELMRSPVNRLEICFFLSLFISFVMVNLASHGRGILLWMAISLFVIFCLKLSTLIRLTYFRALTLFACIVAFTLAIFFIFQFSRHAPCESQTRSAGAPECQVVGAIVVEESIGYFFGGFNRLAAVIDGDLRLPYAGNSFYVGQFLWNAPLAGKFLKPLGKQAGLDLPITEQEYSRQTFSSVRLAGLDDRYVWTTIYGWGFADLRWFSLIIFLFLGGFAQWAWARFRMGSPIGVLSYSFVFYVLMLWPASPQFLENSIWFLLFFNMLLWSERRFRSGFALQ